MKPLVRRIRWTHISCVLCGFLLAGAVGYGYYRDTLSTKLVEFRVTVEEGDTLWGIVAKVATDKEDMSKLTWQVMQDNMQDNMISNPEHLQLGTELVIHVKEARKL